MGNRADYARPGSARCGARIVKPHRFKPRQRVQVDSFGLKNCRLAIASIVEKPKHPGNFYRLRVVGAGMTLPAMYHEDLIKECP